MPCVPSVTVSPVAPWERSWKLIPSSRHSRPARVTPVSPPRHPTIAEPIPVNAVSSSAMVTWPTETSPRPPSVPILMLVTV